MGTEQSAARVHEPRGDNQWLTGLVFVALAAQFALVGALAAVPTPGRAFAQGTIGDLGAIQETALLFDTSLVAVGALNLVGGYLFYRSHDERWILAVFALAGVGATGAGLLPLEAGRLHGLLALAAALCFNLEAIAGGTRLSRPMKAVSMLAGLVGLAFVALSAIGDAGNAAVFGPLGRGGAERLTVYPPLLWTAAFGGYLMAPNGTGR